MKDEKTVLWFNSNIKLNILYRMIRDLKVIVGQNSKAHSNLYVKIYKRLMYDIQSANVTNIMIQIKNVNSTRQAPYISNLDVWYHDGFWHQQASPAT